MATQATRIVISMDNVWTDTGELLDGTIENCSAHFCDDNDHSLAIYDEIEEAIEAGEESIEVKIDGTGHEICWGIYE